MKKTAFVLAALMLVATAGLVSAFGFNSEVRQAIEDNDFDAWKTSMSEGLTEERFNQMRERHAATADIRQAIESGDYAAWKEAVGDRPISEKITEENFSTFVKLHQAKQDHDFEQVQELAEELGFEKPGKGCPGRRGFGMRGE